jgi:hypothetical protein
MGHIGKARLDEGNWALVRAVVIQERVGEGLQGGTEVYHSLSGVVWVLHQSLMLRTAALSWVGTKKV